jgi:hypothetical protein
MFKGAAMESKSAIGYVVYSNERDTFLGKLGVWYSDVRLANVYAEPRAARMALNRADPSFACLVIPIRLSVLNTDIANAVKDAETAKREFDESEKAENGKQPGKKPAKTAA